MFLKSVPSSTSSPAASDVRAALTKYKGKLTRQLYVLLFHPDQVAALPKLRRVEEPDWLAQLREADELLTVEPSGVMEHATSVDNGDSLVGAKQDFIYQHHEHPIDIPAEAETY